MIAAPQQAAAVAESAVAAVLVLVQTLRALVKMALLV